MDGECGGIDIAPLPDDVLLDDHGGGAPPSPPEGGRGGRGGGRGDLPPRRGIRQYLPWIALGCSILAVERITLITLLMSDLGPTAYVLAAMVFLAMATAGAVVGGSAFYRAWHQGHGPTES